MTPIDPTPEPAKQDAPATAAGRRLLARLQDRDDLYVCSDCTAPEGPCVDHIRVLHIVEEALPSIERESLPTRDEPASDDRVWAVIRTVARMDPEMEPVRLLRRLVGGVALAAQAVLTEREAATDPDAVDDEAVR